MSDKKRKEAIEEIERLGIEESAGFKNLIAIRDYTHTTRQMFRELQNENKRLHDQIRQQYLALEAMKQQISIIQARLYGHGPTGR